MFRLSAEDAQWVIAAEKFGNSGLPSVYANFCDVVPQLMLSRIAGIRERLVLPKELQLRELQQLSASRLQLVKNRGDLVLSRDKILLSSDSSMVKKRKRNEADLKIAGKEKEISALDKKIKALLDLDKAASASAKNKGKTETRTSSIVLWKSGKELYKRSDTMTLSRSLSADKISGLISGKIEDIAGYMYVTVRLDTGVGGMPSFEISEAASYDDVDSVVATITARLLPIISNRKPVKLILTVEPEDARVFIDSHLVEDFSSPITVFSGEHTVSVSAPGYTTATRSTMLEQSETYKVDIKLEKQKTVTVAFDTKKMGTSIYFNTMYFGETPLSIKLPLEPGIGEAVSGNIQTWFVFLPNKVANTENPRMIVKANTLDTATKIENTRKTFYWSLAALYISLPVSMLSYGIAMDKANAYNEGKIGHTESTANEVDSWSRISTISQYVSIGLGVNVAIQLFRYLWAANQAVPKYAEPASK